MTLDVPRLSHHVVEVDVLVDGGADAGVVLHELILRHLKRDVIMSKLCYITTMT